MTEKQMGSMTLKDLERIAARFAKAVAEIREGQALFGGGPVAARPFSEAARASMPVAVPASPYPCGVCGREAVERPGENVGDIECQMCGCHLPAMPGTGGVRTNKGVVSLTRQPSDAEMESRRTGGISSAAQLRQVANGEPE